MKFSKFVLFMIIGVFIFNFSSIKAYAAEDVTVYQNQGSTVEKSSIEQSTVEQSTVEQSTVEQSTIEKNSIEQSTVEQDTVEKSSVEQSIVEESPVEESPAEESPVEESTVEESTVEEITIDNKETSQVIEAETIKYSKAELRLLSALIYCEAQGESYNGKLAVGIVVMNRVRSDSYPNTLKGVIYQKYQFSPATNGILKKVLSEYDNGNFTSSTEKECIKAAKAALNGTISITVKGKEMSFSKYLSFSGRLRGYTYQFENHQFK